MLVTQLDINKIRADFPILKREVNGKPLIYFDNGATAQKPNVVIDAISNYYKNQNSNIHRGVHTLSREITIAYEEARATIQKHIHAQLASEIIFTSGTTESINLVADCLGKFFISEGDEIIITEMEHHSNIIPWQVLCEEKNAELKVVPINDAGELILEEFENLLSFKTKVVAFTHISNTLGTINPVNEIISKVRSFEQEHKINIAVLVDGAQAVPHCKPNVAEMDCDFYVFSGHKLFGPTGVGVLFGKQEWLEKLPPYKLGGGIIKTVTFEKTVYADSPLKFEAGTPHISGGIGLAKAIDYVNEIGLDAIFAHEHELLVYATEKLSAIEGLKIIGAAKNKASVISFVIDGIHPFDVGTILDKYGVAVRTGHHCTQPLMSRFGIPGTVRASFAFYNSFEEVDQFVEYLNKSLKMLR